MNNINDFYCSLDDVRVELAKRWNNAELRKAIETELGELFWPEYRDRPRAHYGMQLISPDNSIMFYFYASHVRRLPDEETQTDEEDFFWWCYPPKVNDYIVQYAKEHKLPVRYLDGK